MEQTYKGKPTTMVLIESNSRTMARPMVEPLGIIKHPYEDNEYDDKTPFYATTLNGEIKIVTWVGDDSFKVREPTVSEIVRIREAFNL